MSLSRNSSTVHSSKKKPHSARRSRRAIGRLMESLETRTLLSVDPTNWASVPTAEWRQPTATNWSLQQQYQGFPAATVVSNGSLQYSSSWVANSYGGYPVMAPDGGTLIYNLVQQGCVGVAAGPVQTGQTYGLLAIEGGYSEGGNCLSIYEDGAALSTNASTGDGGGRGVAFGGGYTFQSYANYIKASGISYYTVLRYDLGGALSNIGATGQAGFGANTLSGQPNYIYSASGKGLNPNAIAYNSTTGNIYVTDNLDNRIYIFNASTGAAVNTGSYPSTGYFSFTNPYDMAVDNSGNLWITNQDPATGLSDGKVYKYDQYGNATATTITGLTTDANSVAWDSYKGKLVVARGGRVGTTSGSSNTTNPILYYDLSNLSSPTGYGTSLYSGIPGEMGTAKLSYIKDIDVDAAGNLYVSMASHIGNASADVRVLATPNLSTPAVGTLLYAESDRTHSASAIPDSGSDAMYTLDGYFAMNYNNAPGDQWTWKGITSDPTSYTADIRNLPNVMSSAATPIIRHLNGNIYLYMLGQGNMVEIFQAVDPTFTTSYIFRPVSMVSFTKGDPVGTGTFPGNDPTGSMWIWTDGSNGNAFDGASQAGEFATTTQTQWTLSNQDMVVDASGDLIFSVGKADGTSNYGPAVVEMKCTGYNSNGSPIYQWGSPNTVRALLPANDPQWGQTSGKANSVGGLGYDSDHHVLYMMGGPGDGQGGLGTVLRAYSWDDANPPADMSTLGSYNWSITPPWIVINTGSEFAITMTAAGDYVFVQQRDSTIYAYNRADGTLAGNILQSPLDAESAFPDNYPPLQAVKRTNGDILLSTEGFYSEPFYRILAPGNHSPTAGFSQSVQTSSSPTTVTFSATASDPDGDGLNYTWQFGDGTFDRTNSPTVTHTYTYNGGFIVDLVVHDTKGGVADASSLVTVGPAVSTFTVSSMAADAELDDNDSNGSPNTYTGNTNSSIKVAGGTGAGMNDDGLFPFDLWAAGLMPQDHVSTSTLPTLSFVLKTKTGSPVAADLYAVGMYNTLNMCLQGMGNLYYSGPNDTTYDTAPGVVLLQPSFLSSSSVNGTRYSINSTAQQALANYINAASDAGCRYIMLRLSPRKAPVAASNYYQVYTSEAGTNAPQLSATVMSRVNVSNATSYSVLNNALAAGLSQYGDNSMTFSAGANLNKYLGSTYIRTAYNDRTSSTGSLSFTVNQSSTVYVLYDDALASHKPSWLTTGFTDTTDNITTTAGTFSVYKSNSNYSAGTVTLGANTSDGSSLGAMYSVLIVPTTVQSTNLVGWWKFEEGTGTSVVGSATATGITPDNGSISGSTPVWGDGYLGNTQQFDIDQPGSTGVPAAGVGQAGNALHFNGKDNYVSIADSANLRPSNITVSCWAMSDPWEKPTNSRCGWNGQSYLVYKNNSFYIQTQSGDVQTLIFGVNTGTGWKTYTYTPAAEAGAQPNNEFNVFQWHQYGLTYDGSTLTAYVDGRNVGTATGGGTINNGTGNPLIIGGDGSGTTNSFKGSIDDVRIYNTALSAANTQALGDLGAGIQTVTGMPTAVGASTGLNVSGLTSTLVPANATVTIVKTSDATEGGSSGVFTVSRTGSTGSALTVNYSIGGSAVNGTDDTALTGTVTIASGSSTATITVAATNDTLAELTETVDLTLTSGTGYTVGSPSAATVTITDNDTANYQDSASLVGYWRMDENSGTAVNDFAPSGSTADTGTATGANWGAGQIGNAYHANKTSNYYVSVPNSSDINPTAALSLSVWAKNDSGTTWTSTTAHAFVFRTNSYQIVPVAGSSNVKFGVKIGGTWYYYTTTTGPADVSQWHHYAMTWDGTTITGYIDGVAKGTAAASGALTSNNNALLIGADGTSGSGAFTGYVDEVRLYNTSVSGAHITNLFNQAAMSVTAVQGVTVASNVQVGTRLYTGASGNTFSTFPGNSPKYLGSTLLQTDNASANSTGDKVVGFTVNQPAIVYVLYDDAISGTHRADSTGGWLASGNGFTDTGDNITDSSGHTFSVYKALLTAGSGNTIWLGGNTSDGVNGTGLMYDVLVQPLL